MGSRPTPVHDLKIHPRDRELIAGTHGRSIWIVDVAPLQQLTQRLLAGSEPVLFEGSPGLQFPTRSSGGGSTGHAFWRGDNRASNATIHYWLPSQVNGQVQLTVADADGNVIQTLSGPGGAGLHTVSWNMRTIPAPRPAAELTPAQRRDSLVTMRRADVVGDSLIASGMDSTVVRQVARLLKGEPAQGGPGGVAAASGGGGAGGAGAASSLGQQRNFRDRPGEGGVVSAGGGGGRGWP
jgi:hypothetical protein